jgi:drug/metabolite transporter (DMT)-like permease
LSSLTKGYLIAISGISIWSTTGIFMGLLLTDHNMSALLLAFWRNLLVCTALLPSLVLVRRPLLHIKASQIKFFLFYGLTLALFNSIWIISIRENGVAIATVFGYTSAGFTAIIAYLIFKEKLGFIKIIAVVLSLGGCVLVSNAYNIDMLRLNPLGVTTGLVSGILFSLYTLFGKETAKREINMWTSLLYSFAFSVPFMFVFPFLPIFSEAITSIFQLLPVLSLAGWGILVFLSFIPTLLGYGLYNGSMNYIPASITNLLVTLELPITAILAFIFLDERLTTIQIFGSLLILVAVILVQLGENKEYLFSHIFFSDR